MGMQRGQFQRKQTVLPMSFGERKKGLQEGIKKQLGLKGPKDEKPTS